jgi:hypothetical protein
MSKQVQLRRGNTSDHSTFTGVVGEVTIDTTKKTVVVHDGSTAGGVPLATETALGSYALTSALGDYVATSTIGSAVQAYDADTAKTDTAQTFTAAQRGTITALTDGATITPDFALSNNFSVTLAGSRTVANPTNLVAGQSGSIFITQDGSGSRTLIWGSYWDFATGVAPTLSTTAGAVDRVDYIVRTATSIHTVFTGDYS